ncbi:MAG: MFS transporter [Thomasclavelia sp.]
MKKSILKISLLSVSMLVTTAPAINANIPSMAKAFSEIPLSMVEMISTIPSLFLMISVLTSSFIAKKIGYKQTILLGLVITACSGIIPVFINNFYIVLISRALLGFGIGLFNSLLIGLINYFFDGDEKTSLIGYHEALGGFGGIIITYVAGQLLNINWQASFLSYAIAFPVIFLFWKFVPKVETVDILSKTSKKEEKADNLQNGSFIIAFMVLIFIGAVLNMTMGIKISALIEEIGYGTASDGSLVLMLLSFGSMLSGFLFGKMFKMLKDYILSLGFIVVAIAMLIIGISNNMILTVIGGFLIGFGFRVMMPYLTNIINNSHLKNPALGTSLLIVAYNLGSALAPYGSLLIQQLSWTDNLRGVFYLDCLGFVILAIITAGIITIKNLNLKRNKSVKKIGEKNFIY